MSNRTQATEINGKICVIRGVNCSRGYCSERGCDFPNCANVTEEYATIEEAKKAHPDLEIV